MGSYSISVDTPFAEYYTEEDENYKEKQSQEDLAKLKQYPLQRRAELGRALSKYNGATRIDISEIEEPKIIRDPHKFLTVIKLFEYEANVTPSFGLKLKKGSRYDYIHYVLELNATASVGIFFYDTKRLLSVPQIHNVERMVKSAGLNGAIIIANNVGIPAKQEAKRINDEHGGYGILTIEHFDSLKKRYEEHMV